MLNVLSFGASGSGINNDTLPLQAAMNACAPGDTVYLPTGTYLTDTLFLRYGCNVKGDRAASTLKARTSRQVSLIYAPNWNHNSIIENLVFDLNHLADTGVKFDSVVQGAIIRYNLFKNGGRPAAVFLPAGTAATDRNTSIDHNIFKNVTQGVFSYHKLNNTHVDWNYFDTFEQGISAGGCSDVASGHDTTIDHNTFLQGRRMAIEVCGKSYNLSASYNYIANWRPSLTPLAENYAVCGSSYPYMCDSMGISLATGGSGTVASHNRIYRQPGTSWGIEYTVQPQSSAEHNIIKHAGIAIYDGACYFVGGTSNCTATRPYITNNYGCGGNSLSNTNIFGNWPGSNYYFSSCADSRFPVEDPVPPMPFSLTLFGAGALLNQSPQVKLTSPSSGATFPAGATISVTGSASDSDGSIRKVEFFRNGVLVATATTTPFGHSWTNAAAGSYMLTARATDDDGAVTTSAAVPVTITASSSPSSVFYKGINLNGPATTIEGNEWLAYTSALASGLTVLNGSLWAGSYSFTPSPPLMPGPAPSSNRRSGVPPLPTARDSHSFR